MDRRRFVAFVGSALAAPLLRAQAPEKIRRIGILLIAPRGQVEDLVKAFEVGLRDLGWVNGRNLAIEIRFADGRYDQIAVLARELEQLDVELIVTGVNTGTSGAFRATTRVPIVAALGTDLIDAGFAASLARPGGRVTGVLWVVGSELYAKRLQILKEAVPKVSRVAVLWDPTFENSSHFRPEMERAATALKLNLVWIVVTPNSDADRVVARAIREQADSLFEVGGVWSYVLKDRLVELAAIHRLPAVYGVPAYADSGGLLSHSPSLTGNFRESARYVDRILKGAKAGDLPIERPSKFEMVVNLKTAKVLGLTIPQSVLLRADRVIE